MSFQPDYEDRYRYRLWATGFDPVTIDEPGGWRTDFTELERAPDGGGIFPKFSNKLTYDGNGAEFINFIKDLKGIKFKIRQTREERHPTDNSWQLQYDGYLALSTWEKDENGNIKVKFDSGGIEKEVKNRENDKVEIERTKSIDGVELTPLKTDVVANNGRKIFKFTEMTVGENISETFSNATAHRTPLLEIVSESDDRIFSVGQEFVPYTADASFQYTDLNPVEFNHFYLANNREKTLRIRGDFRVRNVPKGEGNNIIEAALIRTDVNFNVVESRQVYSSGLSPLEWHEFVMDESIILGEEENLMFVISSSIFRQGSSNSSHYIQYDTTRRKLFVEEDSFFEASQSKMVMAHELAERLIEIYTGSQNSFRSIALGRTDIGYAQDGVAGLTGFAHGHWIRGFDREPQDSSNRYKAFATSWADFKQNFATTHNLRMGVDRIGFKQRIRLEEMGFFWNRNVTIHIGYKDLDGKWIYPQVGKLTRKEVENDYFSSIELGFEKGWENEEVMGLDEPNAKTKWHTIIDEVKNSYEQMSKYIGGSYPKEFARRKPRSGFPTLDHKYDTDIFPMDLKRGVTEVYEEKLWSDDPDYFEAEPEGIYSPETATNLRYSPINLLVRHGWSFCGGLLKYLTNPIRHASSEGSTSMISKLIGGKRLKEDDPVVPNDLTYPRYVPEEVGFEYGVDFFMWEQLNGTTVVDGEEIPNLYGLAQFRNEFGKLERGYLINLKPEGAGKWLLKKSAR